jgi:branched-chain amino acid transport system ATP-binding protein
MTHPLLRVQGACKRYGSMQVTRNLSFDLEAGDALGIIGPNGAGKTTLFNLISGDVRADAGSVFDGSDITREPPHRRCRAGIGRSYQVPLPFEGLTVFENLMVGASFGAAHATRNAAAQHCAELLDLTGLYGKANWLAGALTLLDRKRLELARALATRPSVLLLDEVAGGLTEMEAHELVGIVQRIRERGVSIVWIEHVVHALLAVATRLLVINFGEKLAEGEPHAVIALPEVQRVYMGIEVA